MSRSQDKLKQELLQQISNEVQGTSNPQKEALKLVENANQTYKQFESAIKKPLDEESTLRRASAARKAVQFADPIMEVSVIPAISKEAIENKQPKEQKAPKQQQKQQVVQQKPKKECTKQTKPQQQQSSKPQPHSQPQQLKQQQTKDVEEASSQSSQGDRQNYHMPREIINNQFKVEQPQPQIQVNDQSAELNRQALQLMKLQNQLQLHQQENQSIIQQLQSEKQQNAQLEKSLFELKQQSRGEILQLRDQLQETKFQNIEFENKSNYLSKAKETLEINNKSYQEQLDKLQKTYQTVAYQQQQDKLVLIDKDGTIERLHKQVKTLSEDLEQSQKQLKSISDKHKLLEQQFNKIDNDKSHMQLELEYLKSDKHEYLNQLKEKIDKLQAEKGQRNQDVDRMQHNLETVKEERDKWKLQYDQMKVLVSETDELRKRLKLREVENDQLQSDNDKLKWKIRKDPNGVLSDLKIMTITTDNHQHGSVQQQLCRNENEIKQLQEENTRLSLENKQLLKQHQQNEQYLGEIRQMFDRERGFLEDKVYHLDKELNDVNIRHKHEMNELHVRMDENKRRYEQEYRQQRNNLNEHTSPYSVPQLQSKIRGHH